MTEDQESKIRHFILRPVMFINIPGKSIGIGLIIILFFGCGAKKTDEKGLAAIDSIEVHESTDSEDKIDSIKPTDDFDYSECIRGQAGPVTDTSIFPHAIFKLNPDNHTGTETVDLENGERLIISNWGCEYYVLTFRFETERFQADTTNTVYWLNKAVILMSEIEAGINAPLDLQGGIEEIPVYLSSMDSRGYELGEEIVIKDDDIRQFLTLDRVQRINDKRFAIEISYTTGPL